jgi:hypothetical protein
MGNVIRALCLVFHDDPDALFVCDERHREQIAIEMIVQLGKRLKAAEAALAQAQARLASITGEGGMPEGWEWRCDFFGRRWIWTAPDGASSVGIVSMHHGWAVVLNNFTIDMRTADDIREIRAPTPLGALREYERIVKEAGE